MIRAHELTKRFGEVAAVDGLSLAVPEGSVLALLGPNGAGKTTLLRMLFGAVRPTAGTCSVAGHDVTTDGVAVRKGVAVVPESKALYPRVSAGAFLSFYAACFPDADAGAGPALLERWGVALHRRADRLSRGDRTKVLLAAALSRRPAWTLLDEPTEGLDPAATEDLWATLVERVGREDRAGAVIATHRIEEAERVCDRVAVLDGGRLILEGDMDDLRSTWRRLVIRSARGREALARLPGVMRCRERDGRVEATTAAWSPDLPQRLPDDCEVVQVLEMSIREIYLTVVGHGR